MGLDDRLADAKERRAADLPVVQHLHQVFDPGGAQKIAQLAEQIFLEHFLHQAAHEHGSTLDGFEKHVAVEAVADHNVHRAQRYIPGFHIADKVDKPLFPRVFQQRIGFLLQGGALAVLGADVQKTDFGILDAQLLLRVDRADQTELQQEFRRTLGIRTAVHDHGLSPCLVGHGGTHGRTADSLDPLDQQRRAGEQRAGGTGGHERVAQPVRQHLQADHHGRILPLVDDGCGIVMHVHHIVGIGDFHAFRQVVNAVLLENRKDILSPAYQHDLDTVGLCRFHSA